MNIHEFRIRKVNVDGSAFGVSMENGSQVFINSALSKLMRVEHGDLVRAACVQNNKSPDIEWYAEMVEVLEE